MYYYFMMNKKPSFDYPSPKKKKGEGWFKKFCYSLNIGKNVCKTSEKTFKSKKYVNKVRSVIRHPDIKTVWAYTFYDDNSYVECSKCERY